MDLQALEYTREHYDRHAGQYADSREALAARAMGPGAPLKKFHNQIKRQLIQRWEVGFYRESLAIEVFCKHLVSDRYGHCFMAHRQG